MLASKYLQMEIYFLETRPGLVLGRSAARFKPEVQPRSTLTKCPEEQEALLK